MAKSAEEMAETMKAGILEKTGKPFDHWVELLQSSGLAKHGEQMKLLKGEHGLTHGYANFICLAAKGHLDTAPDDFLTAQYQGKESLKPIYDALDAKARSFGDDVEISPKKTSVAFRRSKNFAVITPATKSRIDLGINLKGHAPTDRLLAEKPNAMCTHKVKLNSVDELDDEVSGWLKAAYDLA